MATSEVGSGSGKGGGTGGSIREAGGSMGKKGAAQEEQYFSKQNRQLKDKLKDHSKDELKKHEDAIKAIKDQNNHGGVGYKPDKLGRDVYLNPLLTPPPRPPSSPDDFRNPDKLGHWFPLGFDFTDPLKDKYMFHETLFYVCSFGLVCLWLYSYGPDLKDREWSRREAFLRTHKREALGLPLIDINVVDPDRIKLPTEEELGEFEVTM